MRAYQRAHQLTVDGIVGARTQIAMLAELGAPDTPLARRRTTDVSFILDALRKSEHERQRSAVPGLSQVPLATPQPQLPRWALVVIGVLVAAVLVLGGAWWQSTRGAGR